jgi:hypothetical protein
MHAPPILRDAAIEQCMHYIDGLVGQFVGFDNTLVAHHLHDESTLRLVVPFLHADFASIDRPISAQRIKQSAFEDREKCFGVHAAREPAVWSTMAWYALVASEKLLAIKRHSSIGRF